MNRNPTSLKNDGGDVELIDVVGIPGLVATRGACSVCRASQQTLKGFVEFKLVNGNTELM